MRTKFQWLILVSLVIDCVWLFLPFWWKELYDFDSSYFEALVWNGYDAKITSFVFLYSLVIIYFLSKILMFFRVRGGGFMFTIALLLTVIFSTQMGIAVFPPYESAISQLSSILDGVILAIALTASSNGFKSVDSIAVKDD